MHYYQAEVYEGTIIRNRFIANNIEVLKGKSMPYIKDDKVTQIKVSKVEDIGFFKVPSELEEYLKDELL